MQQQYTIDGKAFDDSTINLAQAIGALGLILNIGDDEAGFKYVSHSDLLQTMFGCKQMIEQAKDMLEQSVQVNPALLDAKDLPETSGM